MIKADPNPADNTNKSSASAAAASSSSQFHDDFLSHRKLNVNYGIHQVSGENGGVNYVADVAACSSTLKRKNDDDEDAEGVEPKTKSTSHEPTTTTTTATKNAVSSSARSIAIVDESSNSTASSTDTIGVTTRSKRHGGQLKHSLDAACLLKSSPLDEDEDGSSSLDGALEPAASSTLSKKKNSKKTTTCTGAKSRLGSKAAITSRSRLRQIAKMSKEQAIRTKLKTTLSPPCLKTRLQKARASQLQNPFAAAAKSSRDLSGFNPVSRHQSEPETTTLFAESRLVGAAQTSTSTSTTTMLSHELAVAAKTQPTYVNDEATESWLTTFRDWSVKNKLTALEQILEMCDYTHIKHVHNFIEPKLQRDYISELPRELILLMLTYIRPRDLNKLAQVSHYWNGIANDSILWKNICRRFKIAVEAGEPETNETGKMKAESSDEPAVGSCGKDRELAARLLDSDPLVALKAESDSAASMSDEPCTSSSAATSAAASCCSPSSPSSSSSEQAATAATEIASAPVTVAVALQTSTKSKTRKQSLSHGSSSSSSSGHSLKGVASNARQLELTKQRLAPTKSHDASALENPRFSFLKGLNPFKRAYLIDYNVTRNWCTRPLPKPIMLKSHDDHVITCLKFDGVRVISGSDDCTLRVWCALTGKLLHTLSGHTGGVWASQLKDNVVISGSTDRTVRVWNIDTGECIHVLTGHTSTVRCLALNGSLVVSGSRDSLLRVWNIETGQCLQILRGHAAAVRCVCFDGNYVVSGSYDFTIRVWEPSTGQCKHVLEGHANRVYSLLFDGERIVSGSLDTTIIVWNVHTGAVIHRLMGHHSLTSGMQIKGDILVSGNADSTVKIWSLKTGECLHTLGGCNRHMSAVTCMSFNEKFVVSSSDDGTVKLWDLQKGEFIRNLLALESGGRGGVVWRISMHKNKLVCAVGSRIGVEETKLILLDFDWPPNRLSDQSAAATASSTLSLLSSSAAASSSNSTSSSSSSSTTSIAPVTATSSSSSSSSANTTSRLIATSSASATTST